MIRVRPPDRHAGIMVTFPFFRSRDRAAGSSSLLPNLVVLRSLIACASIAAGIGAGPVSASEGTSPALERFAGERWMAVSIRDEKAGWVRSSLRREAWEGADAWVLSGEGVLAFVILDRRTRIESSDRTVYEGVPPYRLLFHEASVRTGDSNSRTEIRRSGRDYEVVVVRGGARQVSRMEFRHTLLDALASELLAVEGKGAGEERRARSFLSELPGEEDAVVRVERVLEGAGGAKEFEISTSGPRLRRRSRLAADGEVLEARLGPGFVLRMQPEAEAKRMGAGADLTKLSVTAFVDRPLGDPRKVRRLVVTAAGLPAGDVPRSDRQGVEEGEGGARITLAGESPPPSCSAAPPETAPYLAADAELPADHEEILALARRIAGGEADFHGKASRICAWVHANLRKTSRSFLSSALDVLRRREGDCTEHALLAAALCRAAGVPARIVVGLAYAGDEKRVFGFHAWIEVWCGRWTAMDPAWNEPLADATHIRLAEGSDPYALLPFLGEIRIRVMEVIME
jgi:hypothetical protein